MKEKYSSGIQGVSEFRCASKETVYRDILIRSSKSDGKITQPIRISKTILSVHFF